MHLGPELHIVDLSTPDGEVFGKGLGLQGCPIVYTTRTAHKVATRKCVEYLSSTTSLFANLRCALLIITGMRAPLEGRVFLRLNAAEIRTNFWWKPHI